MAPAPRTNPSLGPHSSRLVYTLFSLASASVSRLLRSNGDANNSLTLVRRESEFDPHQPKYIVFAVLIPILVLLSGLFAGLTLGYMSLDQTQLNVLSVSGTPEQRKYANQIKPIRQNGHLLLVTLLLANMIVNETLPVISDPVLGGGVQSVVVSTVLIVIFSEIIPQSLFTRHGLYLGAKGAGLTRVLIWGLGIVSWPVAKLLDWILGSNHGIIYRRVELKELIAMHSSASPHGGDLKSDTVTIIGATLDLQEKVVSQAMTPISDVFMLSIDSKLDYALLKKIVSAGHSRVPVYEEVDVPVSVKLEGSAASEDKTESTQKVKKILGILLVKQCVLLDPKDATPIRNLQLNKVPFIPKNESLLGILDKFQEGRSHMAIVSRFSAEKAKSVKKAVKSTLTQRLKERVGIDTSDSSDSSDSESETEEGSVATDNASVRSKWSRRKKRFLGGKDKGDKDATLKGEAPIYEKDYAADSGNNGKSGNRGRPKKKTPEASMELGEMGTKQEEAKKLGFGISTLEASMPADAVLAKDGANEFLQGFDPAIMPLGIITLEDVLEELIGEEIYDEFDMEGAHGEPYVHAAHSSPAGVPTVSTTDNTTQGLLQPPGPVSKSLANVRNLSFLRSRSAPPVQRDGKGGENEKEAAVDDLESSKPAAAQPGGTDGLKEALSGTGTGNQASLASADATTSHALEAVLLDRKRRIVAAGTSTPPIGTPSVRARSGPKGKFKSGPIKKNSSNPSDRDDDVAGDTRPASLTEKEEEEDEVGMNFRRTPTHHSSDGRIQSSFSRIDE